MAIQNPERKKSEPQLVYLPQHCRQTMGSMRPSHRIPFISNCELAVGQEVWLKDPLVGNIIYVAVVEDVMIEGLEPTYTFRLIRKEEVSSVDTASVRIAFLQLLAERDANSTAV